MQGAAPMLDDNEQGMMRLQALLAELRAAPPPFRYSSMWNHVP